MKPYFAILTTQSGDFVPMTNFEGEFEFFETQEQAEAGAKASYYGEHYGWEVFEMGGGISQG